MRTRRSGPCCRLHPRGPACSLLPRRHGEIYKVSPDFTDFGIRTRWTTTPTFRRLHLPFFPSDRDFPTAALFTLFTKALTKAGGPLHGLLLSRMASSRLIHARRSQQYSSNPSITGHALPSSRTILVLAYTTFADTNGT